MYNAAYRNHNGALNMKKEDVKIGMKVRIIDTPASRLASEIDHDITQSNKDRHLTPGMVGEIISHRKFTNAVGVRFEEFGDWWWYAYESLEEVLDEELRTPKPAPKKVDRYRVGQIFTVSNSETSPTLVMLVSAFGSIYLSHIGTGNWWSNRNIDINLSVTQKEIDYLKGDKNNTIGISFASFKDMQAGVPAVYTGNKRIVHYTEMHPVNYESEKAYFSKEEFLKDHPNATFVEFVG
jgi:hypothetical protein